MEGFSPSESERLSQLDQARLNDTLLDVDPLDEGAGVGPIPAQPSDNCGISPSFLPPAVLDPCLLSADAQRNLTESQEYQMLLSQLNAVAENIVDRSGMAEHNEVLANDEAVTEAEVLAIPSPGRKRSFHEGGNRSSSSKKRFLEMGTPHPVVINRSTSR